MKTNSGLEDFIKANRDEFDFREPSQEVWNKISSKNRKPKIFLIRNTIIRVAAVVAIIVATSAVLWQTKLLNRANYVFYT